MAQRNPPRAQAQDDPSLAPRRRWAFWLGVALCGVALGGCAGSSAGPTQPTGVGPAAKVVFTVPPRNAAAYCWGDNVFGQLGNGSTTGPQQCLGVPCSTTPVAVSGGLSFATVSAGHSHACALTTNGAAYCWGHNFAGDLGNGSTTDSSTPVAVSGGLTF